MQDVDLKDVYVYNKKKTALYKAAQCFYKKKRTFLYLTPIYLFDICFYFAAKIILFFEYC